MCNGLQAETIARKLVQEKLAACVNVIERVKSFYIWEGKLCEDAEKTLLIKIRKGDFARLQSRLQQIHPDEVPEIVELSVSDVNTPYLQWLYQMTDPQS